MHNTNRIAEIIRANSFLDGDEYLIIGEVLIGALADYFEAETQLLHKYSRPHDCSARCYFNRAEFIQTATGE